MIKLNNVNFSYQEDKKILKNINLLIESGKVIVLAGKSGCGKTTLLKILNGLIPHFVPGTIEGEVTINEKDIRELTFSDISMITGTVFQNPKAQFFCMNSTNELAFESENNGVDPELIKEQIKKCSEKMNISHLLNKDISKLSGGQKQIIACASISILSHDVILLDEPTANLDIQAIQKIKELIAVWKSEGKTIIVAEHRLSYLINLLDELIILENGEITDILNHNEVATMTNKQFNEVGLRSPWAPMLTIDDNEKNHSNDYIEFENIKFKYKYAEDSILDIPFLKIPKGKVTALIGNNGCGKSTLAKYLAGLEKNYFHKFFFLNNKILMSKEVFMVFQDVNNQLSANTVLSEWEICSKKCRDFERESTQLLKELNLEINQEMNPQNLSGGEKQRVAIGEGVIAQSEILILDEPTSGLDYFNMIRIVEVIKKLMKKKKFTVLLITHDYDFLLRLANEVVVLENGRVSDQFELNNNSLSKSTLYFKGSEFKIE
ncbi:ABC transporter ATP-binding protein [Staphylococcus debuckii]|uniref:ABC transporter ATP-binding protein n=1 Tax=Staphylococcus debuckii TaxID=2044912 RepID=UPI000F43858D|nr:ABC transporter ATP-binding protein [Staphylococcus debuckii]AYU54414.1 ATP-binding cassette domain-containing protein [Staphylococcus debuckii]